LLQGCSQNGSDRDLSLRFEFLKASDQAGVEMIFDKRTGCISEIQRTATAAEFMNATPEEAKGWTGKIKQNGFRDPADALHGGIATFGQWKCPNPVEPKGLKQL